MRGLMVTAFVAEAPVLGWIDAVFRDLSPQVPIPAGSLAPGWPQTESTPIGLRAEIAARIADDESADPVWAAIVARCRTATGDAGLWRLVVIGLALRGLRRIDKRHSARDLHERRDLQSDLIEGLLAALPRIDLARPNIERRLLDAARRQLKRGRSSRHAEIPADLDWVTYPGGTPGSGAHNWSDALTELGDEAAAAGHRLDPLGLELIGRTVIDRQTLPDAAADLGLTLDAAYKRRQRTEARLATVYRINVRRRAKGRLRTPDPPPRSTGPTPAAS